MRKFVGNFSSALKVFLKGLSLERNSDRCLLTFSVLSKMKFSRNSLKVLKNETKKSAKILHSNSGLLSQKSSKSVQCTIYLGPLK